MNFPSLKLLEAFKKTRGAISVHEACAIHWLAEQAPEGMALDLGTHCGKAAMMAAAGFVGSRKFYLVDPAFDKTNLEAWKHSDQGHPDNAWPGFFEHEFCKSVRNRVHMATAKPYPPDNETVGKISSEIPVLHGDYSTHAIPTINGPFSFAFVDSDQHSYELVKAELELLRNRMVIDGIIAFHDFGSQFLGVEQAMREMLQGGQYEELGIPWQDIKPWVAANGDEEGNVSWHHCDNPAPCFVGALRRVK